MSIRSVDRMRAVNWNRLPDPKDARRYGIG